MNLLRDFATYNIVVPLLAVGLLYYHLGSTGMVPAVVRRYRLAVGLFVYVSLYYVLSLLFTHDYAANFRMFEVVFVAGAILVLGRSRGLLRVALQGSLVCGWAVGIAMASYIETSDRLGQITVGGYRLGNPVQLGGVLALSLLTLAVDRGRWLNLGGRPVALFASLAVTIALLYLTTSRGAWLVVVGCTMVVVVFCRGQRLRMLLAIAMLGLILQALLLTRYGPGVQRGLDRTFGQDQSARHRTSGRSDQWIVAYSTFTESLGSVVYGHGPGMGPAVYAAESRTAPGIKYAVGREAQFHSLFMQVAVETGVLGLAPLVMWFALVLSRAFDWMHKYGEALPLAAVVGYLCIAGTVGAQGTTSGVFLGLGLLASSRPLHGRLAYRERTAALSGRLNHVAVGRTA
jgi:O-antigen ligase